MVQNWFLVQVANEMLSHMADDIRYLGQTTFRGSRNYEVPCEVTILFSATTILSAVFQPIK